MQETGSPGRRTLAKRTAAVVGGIAVVAGIGIGGFAIANAQDGSGTGGTSHSSEKRGGKGGDMRGGEKRGDGMRGGQMATVLAEALDKDVETVEQALREVREEMRADVSENQEGELSTTPTDAERDARAQEMTDALAEKLDVDPAVITDALEQARDEQDSERTAAVTERLDEAVDEGTITEADKASILKAIESGVLNGPGGAGGPGGR